MHRNTKVSTCCYCGNRTALVLDEGHHELVCGSCGAPLHDLKMLPMKNVGRGHRELVQDPVSPGKPKKSKSKYKQKKHKREKPFSTERKRKRSSFWSEAFDLIEDLID